MESKKWNWGTSWIPQQETEHRGSTIARQVPWKEEETKDPSSSAYPSSKLLGHGK